MLRRLYNWTMAKAGHPHAELWLALFAFVEASFFPVPPHPLLGLMCLAEPKKAIRFAAIATVASVLGGLLGYAIGWGLYDLIGDWLIAALGIQEMPIDERTVDVWIGRLRRALSEDGEVDPIRTVRSAGYSIDFEG